MVLKFTGDISGFKGSEIIPTSHSFFQAHTMVGPEHSTHSGSSVTSLWHLHLGFMTKPRVNVQALCYWQVLSSCDENVIFIIVWDRVFPIYCNLQLIPAKNRQLIFPSTLLFIWYTIKYTIFISINNLSLTSEQPHCPL